MPRLLLLLVAGSLVVMSSAQAGETKSDPYANVTPLEFGSVMRGRDLFAKNCAQCHGVRGQGASNWHQRDADGKLQAPPLNGTAHTWHHPKKLLMRTIKKGGVVMPAFGGTLSDAEVSDIIHWFQSLWPIEIYAQWDRANKKYQAGKAGGR